MLNKNEPITFDKAFRIVLAIGLILLALYTLNFLSSVLVPFFVAILLAYMLNPLVCFFQYKLKFKKRAISVFASLIFIGLLLFGAVSILKPVIAKEVQQASSIVQNYSTERMQQVESGYLANLISENIDKIKANEEVMAMFKSQDPVVIVKKALESLGGVYNSSLKLLSGISGVFLGLLYFLFALLQYDSFFGKWNELIPKKHQSIIRLIFTDVKTSMSNYFRAQFLVAFTVGILFAIGFSIVGLPMAVVLGLFIGMLNMVPYLQIIGLLPATALAFIHSLETGQEFYIVFLFVLLVFVVVQVIQDAFLVPKIMGKTTGLNAVVILLGLSIWGKLLGFIGLIVAIPLTFLVLSYYKRIFVEKDPGLDALN